jgi:hypothetical protein
VFVCGVWGVGCVGAMRMPWPECGAETACFTWLGFGVCLYAENLRVCGCAAGYYNVGKGSTWEGGVRMPGFAHWYALDPPVLVHTFSPGRFKGRISLRACVFVCDNVCLRVGLGVGGGVGGGGWGWAQAGRGCAQLLVWRDREQPGRLPHPGQLDRRRHAHRPPVRRQEHGADARPVPGALVALSPGVCSRFKCSLCALHL